MGQLLSHNKLSRTAKVAPCMLAFTHHPGCTRNWCSSFRNSSTVISTLIMWPHAIISHWLLQSKKYSFDHLERWQIVRFQRVGSIVGFSLHESILARPIHGFVFLNLGCGPAAAVIVAVLSVAVALRACNVFSFFIRSAAFVDMIYIYTWYIGMIWSMQRAHEYIDKTIGWTNLILSCDAVYH